MQKIKLPVVVMLFLFAILPVLQASAEEGRATLTIPQSSYPHSSVFVVQNGSGGPVPHHDILERYDANEEGVYTLQYSGQHYAQVNKGILILAWGAKPALCRGMSGCNGFAFRIASPAQYTMSNSNGDGVDITGLTDH